VIDSVLLEINNRFSNTNIDILRSVSSLSLELTIHASGRIEVFLSNAKVGYSSVTQRSSSSTNDVRRGKVEG
jgi:hypothetical protein